MHFMHDVFWDMLDHFMVIYLDDVLSYSSSLREHWKHVCSMLQQLREHQLFAKHEKYQFAQITIDFLSHRISLKGMEMDSEKLEALQVW